MAVTLDTLEFARQLREAGFTEPQAEGQARAIGTLMTDSLVTKDDLRSAIRALEARFNTLESTIDSRFAEQTAQLDGKLADLERRVTVRLLAGIGVVSALVRIL